MATSDIINSLQDTLMTAQLHLPYVSLRVWFEGGELKFFLTNLPPRNSKRNVISTDNPKQSQDLRVPYEARASTPAAAVEPSPPTLPPQPPTNSLTAGRTRPRRKRRCPPSPCPSPTEDLRAFHGGASFNSTSAEVSNLDVTRNLSVVNIPCRNSFQILADLQDSDDHPQSDRECFTPPIGCFNLCFDCGFDRVENQNDYRCEQCGKRVEEFNKLNPSGQDCGDDSISDDQCTIN